MLNEFLRKLPSCLNFVLVAVSCLPACVPRKFQNSSQLENSDPSSVRLDRLMIYDLSVIFPAPGLPLMYTKQNRSWTQVPNDGGTAFDIMSAVFHMKAKDKIDFEYDDTTQKTLDVLEAKGFWPKLVSDESDAYLSKLDFESILASLPGTPKSKNSEINPPENDPAQSQEGPFNIRAYQPSSTNIAYSELATKVNRDKAFRLLNYDMRDVNRWRVVSFRIDPCPYGHRNLNEKNEPILASQENFPSKICSPEVRLIAQPVIGYTIEESAVGNGLPKVDIQTRINPFNNQLYDLDYVPRKTSHFGWYFADYAVHLFYRIDESALKTLLQKNLEIRRRWADICNSGDLPLSVHPCLERSMFSLAEKDTLLKALQRRNLGEWRSPLVKETEEKFEAWKTIDYANDFQKALKPELKSPYKAAVMISTNNRDPWQFFLLERKNNDPFLAKKILALNTEKKDYRTKDPRFIESLDLGKSQIVPRGAVLKIDNIRKRDDSRPRFYPPSRPELDSLDFFVRTEVNGQQPVQYPRFFADNSIEKIGLNNIQLTGSRKADLNQVVSRINNPHINDEFSVDCATCHLATSEQRNESEFRYPKFPKSQFVLKSQFRDAQSFSELFKNIGPGAKWGNEDPIFGLWNRFEYTSPRTSYLLPPSSLQMNTEQSTDVNFIFNQFSIYRNLVRVSTRVSNEAEMAVNLSNKWFLGIKDPNFKECDNKLLNICADFHERHGDFLDERMQSQMCLNFGSPICEGSKKQGF
jgi:hypothetical protein